ESLARSRLRRAVASHPCRCTIGRAEPGPPSALLEFIDHTLIPFFLSLYEAVGYVGVGLAVGLETFIPIIPSEVIVPMAGWKVSQSAADARVVEPLTHAPWSWLAVLVIDTLGEVLGSLAVYLIGARRGPPLPDL